MALFMSDCSCNNNVPIRPFCAGIWSSALDFMDSEPRSHTLLEMLRNLTLLYWILFLLKWTRIGICCLQLRYLTEDTKGRNKWRAGEAKLMTGNGGRSVRKGGRVWSQKRKGKQGISWSFWGGPASCSRHCPIWDDHKKRTHISECQL